VHPDEIGRLLPALPIAADDRGGDRYEKVADIYREFASAGIRYADEPIASSGTSQAIRPPDQIVAPPGWAHAPRCGNCLDLSLAFAGACLYAGLHPLIIVCEPVSGGSAHALVVVWLHGDWRAGGHSDYPFPAGDVAPMHVLAAQPRWPGGGLRSAREGPGGWVPVDISCVSQKPNGTGPTGFDEAVTAAEMMLALRTEGSGYTANGWRWGFGVDIGAGYQREVALDLPGRPISSPLDAPYFNLELLRGAGPRPALLARTRAVPFVARAEIDQVLGWCLASDDEKAESLRIGMVTGVGGAGKTRLAAEAAYHLARRGWYTGFLPHPVPSGVGDWLASVVGPLAVVVDYVEAEPTDALISLMRSVAVRSGRTVVLLTARTSGDWWSRLEAALNRSGIPATVGLFPLRARHPSPALLFGRAYRRFAASVDHGAVRPSDTNPTEPTEPADPVDGDRWTTLDLVMLAWLAANTGPRLPDHRTRLYDAIVERELEHWANVIQARHGSPPAMQTLRSAAAVISVLSPSPEQLTNVLAQGQFSDRDAASRVTEQLAMLLTEPDGTLGLRPDPIAEHLLLAVLPTRPDLYRFCVSAIDATPAARNGARTLFDLGGAERFCNNLTRAGQALTPHARETAQELADIALRQRPEDLWRAAFDTALLRGGAFVPALTALARQDDSPVSLPDIDARVPFRHSELRELALEAARRSLPAPADPDADPDGAASYAAALDGLGVRLSQVGKNTEALTSLQRAATLYRRLAEANPRAFLPNLAVSLHNLATLLSEAGQPNEALSAVQEALRIRRELADSNPGTFLPAVAESLHNLGIYLADSGQRDKALAPVQEAVAIRRWLTETTGTFLPDLAESLNNLGSQLAAVGRRDEALAPVLEAVALYRRLAEATPAIHLPDLATSLTNLGAVLFEAGRREQALAPTMEAVALYRRLAESHPDAFLPDLAKSLHNLGVLLSEAGRRDEALAPADEAAVIYRRLAEANPAAFLSRYAVSWNSLASRLADLGRHDEALTMTEEAVTICRRLAEANPGPFLPELAAALNSLGNRLAAVGRRSEALTMTEEAAVRYRRLAEANPGPFLPELATALDNLGNRLADVGRRTDALTMTEDAVAIRRQLAEANISSFLPDLAQSLRNLGTRLREAGRRDDAVASVQESVSIYRRLVEANTGAFLPDLAMSLNNLGALLSEAGRREEALAPVQESAAIYRHLAEANPGPFLPDLAMSLTNLGVQLSVSGRRDEALAPTQQAVAIYRQLAEGSPGPFLPDFAAALSNLGVRLAELGRSDEALAPAEEAASIYRRLAEANPGAFLPRMATSLDNLGIRLAKLGRGDEALTAAKEAASIYQRLAEANPAAFLPDLAASLKSLGVRLAEVGRREEALAHLQEAADTYRRLAEAKPDAFTPDLASSLHDLGALLAQLARYEEALGPTREAIEIGCHLAEANPRVFLQELTMSLNNLGAMLREIGQADEIAGAYRRAWRGLSPALRAMLRMDAARWTARNTDGSVNESLILVEAAAAVADADAETSPERAASARRFIRKALRDQGLSGRLPDPPQWITVDVPDQIVDILNQLMNAATWRQRAPMLRASGADVFWTDTGHSARTAMAALHGDSAALVAILSVLDAATQFGLDHVLDEVCAAEQHDELLTAWIDTPTWPASRRHLRDHPDLLTDPRTIAMLEGGANDQTYRQHLAIVRLHDAGMDLDDIYDVIADASDAADAALAALDRADIARLTELWSVAPHLSGHSFLAPFLSSIILAVSGSAEQAETLIRIASKYGDRVIRSDAAARLRRLAEGPVAHAGVLSRLADLLEDQPPLGEAANALPIEDD
jgi:tetratricopeptide (TPR) repeat protein